MRVELRHDEGSRHLTHAGAGESRREVAGRQAPVPNMGAAVVTVARVLLIALVTLPLAWSLYAEPRLGRECTSSECLREFFADRSPVTLWAAGAACWQLVLLAFPEVPWWKLAAVAAGAVMVGHVLWYR